jgi:hypothetical protein
MSLLRLVASCSLLLTVGATLSGTEAHAAAPVDCQPNAGSLSRIGCGLVQQLGSGARGASVAIVELKSDRPLPNPDALRERVQTAVTSALGAAGGGPSKLRVELRIEKVGGVLRASAELRRAVGLWRRLRHDKPQSEAHGFVEVPLDAELRALIPPPPLVVSEALRIKSPERGIVALACGPLAEDGGQELALVSRSTVRVGRIQNEAFVERARASWSALSPVASAPLREPIGSAEITERGTLRVGLSDRRDGLELSRDLVVTSRFEAQLPVPGGGCSPRSALGVVATNAACAPRAASVSTATIMDALAGWNGAWLGRAPESGNLLAGAGAPVPSGARVGAQLALGDADGDGAPELGYSADTLDATKDRLTFVTLQGNKPVRRFELAAPGISAIAICQRREGPAMAPVVVATADELWLLR